MFKKFWNFLAVTLAITSCLNHVDCQTVTSVSWIYQGTAQQNNSALTFNYYDTLNLICRATTASAVGKLVFAVSKGTIPTGMTISSGLLSLKNGGTLIYSDLGGIQSGYENFVIYASPYNGVSAVIGALTYDYRYVSVGTLKTADSATYICSAAYFAATTDTPSDTSSATFATSGKLTITVNTKSGQAHSARTYANGLITYTAAIMGASKLLF